MHCRVIEVRILRAVAVTLEPVGTHPDEAIDGCLCGRGPDLTNAARAPRPLT